MTDYCGTCGWALKESPTGGRVACHPDGAQYWTPHEPLQADAQGHYKMTGDVPQVQTACVDPEGKIVRHAPLHLYRAP